MAGTKGKWKPGQSGNPAGRRRGIKARPPIFTKATIKEIYDELMECYDGKRLMVEAAARALRSRKNPRLSLAHMELKAKVENPGAFAPTVNINLSSNIDPSKLKNITTTTDKP